MPSRLRATGLARAALAVQVAGSQVALAASNYVVLAIAARNLDAAGFAALTSYYLLINTVGRGLFSAVELEATRATARAASVGSSTRRARLDARRNARLLLAGALALVAVSTPLLSGVLGSSTTAIALLALGAVSMAVSYVVRGPLAGEQRYRLYAATFWLEAVTGVAAGLALAAFDVHDEVAWISIFALAPLAAGVFARRGRERSETDALPTTEAGSVRTVFYAAALLLAGQGVWNLAPVLVTARLAEDPATAAGFVTAAVILRAPVLFFPAAQALLLPTVTAAVSTGDHAAARRITRRLGIAVTVAGVVWVLAGVTVVPALARAIFAATVAPPTVVLALLAVSTVIGAATQLPQTHLIARGRQRAVAATWTAGLAVLLVAGLAAPSPLLGAAAAQALAAVVVLAVLIVIRHRTSENGVKP